MMRPVARLYIWALVLGTGCPWQLPGTDEGSPGSSNPPPQGAPSATPFAGTIEPAHQTPGFFRHMRDLLIRYQGDDPSVAMAVWRQEISAQGSSPELPPMSSYRHDTLGSLLYVLPRVLELPPTPAAHAAAAQLLESVLGLDPGLVGVVPSALLTSPGAQAVAVVGLEALATVVGESSGCMSLPTGLAAWHTTLSLTRWVQPACEAAEIDDYCVPEHWEDETCYPKWICDGGRYEWSGRYEWRCYGNDCDYEWVPKEVWVNDCAEGYWDEVCEGGGMVPGFCTQVVSTANCPAGGNDLVVLEGWWDLPAHGFPVGCHAARDLQRQVVTNTLVGMWVWLDWTMHPTDLNMLEELLQDTGAFLDMDETSFEAAILMLTQVSRR